jgi:hypothetical protein
VYIFGYATKSTSSAGSAAVCLPARAPLKLFASIYGCAPLPTILLVSFLLSTPHLIVSLGAHESRIYRALYTLNACIALVPWSPRPQLWQGDDRVRIRGKERDDRRFVVPTIIFLWSMPFNVACALATTSIFRIRLLARFSLNVICKMAESMGFPET